MKRKLQDETNDVEDVEKNGEDKRTRVCLNEEEEQEDETTRKARFLRDCVERSNNEKNSAADEVYLVTWGDGIVGFLSSCEIDETFEDYFEQIAEDSWNSFDDSEKDVALFFSDVDEETRKEKIGEAMDSFYEDECWSPCEPEFIDNIKAFYTPTCLPKAAAANNDAAAKFSKEVDEMLERYDYSPLWSWRGTLVMLMEKLGDSKEDKVILHNIARAFAKHSNQVSLF